MPKKKVQAKYVEEKLTCESICPYCGEDNYHEFYIGVTKEEEPCLCCAKIYIVEIGEKRCL